MEITKKLLKEKYSTMTNDDLCTELNITKPTLVKYLKIAGIPLKGKGNRNSKKKIIIT